MESKSFWQHLGDLRGALVKSAFCIGLGILICFIFFNEIFAALSWPLAGIEKTNSSAIVKTNLKIQRISNHSSTKITYPLEGAKTVLTSPGSFEGEGSIILPPGGFADLIETASSPPLVLLSPLEGMVTALKVSFWLGLSLTFPLWSYFLLQFVLPALRQEEKSLVAPFLTISSIFMLLGVAFAYFITLPLANNILYLFNANLGANLWTVESYLNFTFVLLFATAMAFEIAALLLILVHFGIISVDSLIEKRRHAIVASFILGAVLTTPDVITQFCLAIPLMGLYEIVILWGKIRRPLLHMNVN